VSRLTELLGRLRNENPALAADLEREVTALTDRRSFGLNFERHVPEAVELPGRKVRRGDKVRTLPPRGDADAKADERLWRVIGTDRKSNTASLELMQQFVTEDVEADDLACEVALDDLVVVAEFRDSIYPGLVSTGKVERGGDKPFHTVINAENYHALETLLFTHRGKVDCIYIDPPYNTGAKDWKYNNDYVEGDDLYRHSKWLAFMERRLLLAKELLNPDDSVLIVTIDEKEYLRLGLLLEQTFPESRVQMVSSVISPGGTGRQGEFSRTDEYIFFVMFGSFTISAEPQEGSAQRQITWSAFQRSDIASRRGSAKGGTSQFYPLYVNPETRRIEHIGEPLHHGQPIEVAPEIEGLVKVFPVRPDGTEMNWGLTSQSFAARVEANHVKVGSRRYDVPQPFPIYYLKAGVVSDIESGRAVITGYGPTGEVLAEYVGESLKMPTTNWTRPSHNARAWGTDLLRAMMPDRRFPFPKSLYAVEDVIRLFVKEKPNAVVVDFFAGSGTTGHAVLRLNSEDDGLRTAILVTNNEVGVDEQRELQARGLRPSDADWESLGICDHITKPRIKAAITGTTPEGAPIRGDYKFVNEFPISDGFEENVEFFTLTYESPLRVSSNREFERIAPLLWLRAGSRGRRIEDISSGWDVADTYGVLIDLDFTDQFVDAVVERGDAIVMAFIVTDEDRLFESVARALPEHVEPVRLYEAYMRNFEIESGRGLL
jgi:adenine-specific DNA-methyltransferase